MFLNAYQTTTLARLNISKVRDEIEVAHVTGALELYPETALKLYFIIGRNPAFDRIPSFFHPLNFDWGIVVDLRSYGPYPLRRIELGKEVDVGPALTEVNVAVLQSIWQESDANRRELSGISPLALQVYATWLGEAVARSVGADPQTQLDIILLSAWFYISLHLEPGDVESDTQLMKYARRIGMATFGNTERAFNLIQQIDGIVIQNLAEYVKAVQGLASTRTDNVSLVSILTVISGGWWGTPAAKEQLAVALEFPPQFLSILYTVVTEKMYSKSVLRETALRYDRRGKFTEFQTAFLGIIRNGNRG